MNGVMLIHPMILYIFYAYYIYILCIDMLFMHIKVQLVLTRTKFLIYLSVLLILISIILGCWWAEQELSWGGWWSWDFVELLALNFFLYFFNKVHQNKIVGFLRIYSNISIGLTIILIAILSVRFNIINSIHNFVNLQSQNQYFYYIVVFIVGLLAITSVCRSSNLVNNRIKALYSISTFCILYLYMIFFYDLIDLNIFKWSNIKLLNMHNLYIYMFVLLLLFYLLQYNINFNVWLFIVIYTICDQFITYIDMSMIIIIFHTTLVSYFSKNKTFKYLHGIIITYLYITLYQIYTFGKNIVYYDQYNNHIIKINNQTILNNSFIADYFNNFFKEASSTIYYIQNIRDNFKVFGNDFFKNIFEKKIYIIDLQLNEFYSYNLQKLLQLNGIFIYASLLLILIILMEVLIKKQQLVYL